MRKKCVILVTVLLLAVLPSAYTALAQPSRLPHENPAAARDSFDLASLLTVYNYAFSQAAFRQYPDASNTLNDLKHANMSEELRYTAERYNTLSQQLFQMLNDVESRLDEAVSLIYRGEISPARQKLKEAQAGIRNVRPVLDDVVGATEALHNRFAAFAPLERNRLNQVNERLLQTLARLKELLDQLNELRESIAQAIETGQQIVITTRFSYPTFLGVTIPENGYPGLPITISGELSSTGSAVDRGVRVLFDNIHLAEDKTQNQFRLEVTIPPQTLTGRHTVTVVVAPEEHYLSTSKSSPINITRIPIVTEIQVPWFTLTPRPIQISGKAHYSLSPLPDARVILTFRSAAATLKTGADGSFTATLSPPFELFAFGPQTLTVTVEPAESWYAPLTTDRRILTFSLANLGMVLIAFISLGSLAFRWVRTRPSRLRKRASIGVTPPGLPVAPPSRRPDFEPNGARGRILAAYNAGLMAVGKAAGTRMAPYHTIREFAKMVTPLIPTAIPPFRELSTLAEIVLYSTQQMEEETLARAEQLAGIISGELQRGAT